MKTKFGAAGRVSVEYFTKHILPPLPDGLDLDAIMETMKRASRNKKSSRRLGPFAQNGCWRGFAAKTPGDGDRTKEQAFKHFPAIIDAICKAARLKRKDATLSSAFVQKVKYEKDQSKTTHPDDTIPDACIVPRNPDGSISVALDTVTTVGWYRRYSTRITKKAVSVS